MPSVQLPDWPLSKVAGVIIGLTALIAGWRGLEGYLTEDLVPESDFAPFKSIICDSLIELKTREVEEAKGRDKIGPRLRLDRLKEACR